jgi:hypothetical protein
MLGVAPCCSINAEAIGVIGAPGEQLGGEPRWERSSNLYENAIEMSGSLFSITACR